MKKYTLVAFLCISLSFPGLAQDNMGYRTFDMGGEYQWSKLSQSTNLQVAFNAETHHSIVLSAGFKTVYRHIDGTHNNERGKGLGGSLGYRYYFSVLPQRFFLGARCDLWSMTMYRTADPTISIRMSILQPKLELGYTFIINDKVFITPYLAYSKLISHNTSEDKYVYGNGYEPIIALSGGLRF